MISGLQISKKLLGEESLLEKLMKSKIWLFFILHKLLANTVCSLFLYQILLVIETIQMVYYSLHPKMTFFFSTQALDIIRVLLEYFQVFFSLKLRINFFFLVQLHAFFHEYQHLPYNPLHFNGRAVIGFTCFRVMHIPDCEIQEENGHNHSIHTKTA